jgi:hypothetical protein
MRLNNVAVWNADIFIIKHSYIAAFSFIGKVEARALGVKISKRRKKDVSAY